MGRECRERIPRHRFQMKRPWCMSGIADLKWRGKRFRHSRRMCNLQFCATGKRPIEKGGTIVLCCTTFYWQSSRPTVFVYLCGWFLYIIALYCVVYLIKHPERPRYSLKPVSQSASLTIYVAVSLSKTLWCIPQNVLVPQTNTRRVVSVMPT